MTAIQNPFAMSNPTVAALANQMLGPGPTWVSAFTKQAETAIAGVTLINGTQNILTWTAPNDGGIHYVFFTCYIFATSAMTGGQINDTFTDLGSNPITQAPFVAGGLGTGASNWNFEFFPVKAGTTVTIAQGTALTAGAAKAWASIWGT